MEKTCEHGSVVAPLQKFDAVERCWIDPANFDYVVEVRRLDGTVTEERISLMGAQLTVGEIALLKRISPAAGSMKD